MKKIINLLLIVCLLSSFSVQTRASSYNDISGHWAEESINQAVSWGLISGYPDGSFSPDTFVTLAELLTMLVPMVSGERPEITDNSDWYIPYVNKAYELGILNGLTPHELEGLYDAPAMRMVANTLFSNSIVCLGLADEFPINDKNAEKSKLALLTFVDSSDFFSDLFLISTYFCVAHELVIGNEHRELQPYSYITRAEAVTMLRRTKAYQTKRLNGMHYVDPFSYSDYHYSCIKTVGGFTYPISDSDRPIVKDNGIVYMSSAAITKIMEAYKMNFKVHSTVPGDVYYGFYNSYITVNPEIFYSHIKDEDSFYGNSNTHSGYISDAGGKKYEYSCDTDTDKGLVVRNIPMLPVEDVLNYFQIPYKSVILSPEKGSIIINFFSE